MFSETEIILLKSKSYKFAYFFLKTRNYGTVEKLISFIARINYYFCLGYRDACLEEIADKLAERVVHHNIVTADKNADEVIFYDAYGWANRGLTEQYLQELVKHKRLTYIYDGNQKQPDDPIMKLLNKNNCKIFPLSDKKNFKKRVNSIKKLSEEINPLMIFIHSAPSSFTPFILRKIFKSSKIININITDHAYWLGYSIIDTVLEFRNFGGFVSKNGRGVRGEKIFKIPFYPIIATTHKAASDLSFIDPGMLTIFTGGDLSKINANVDAFFQLMKMIVEKYDHVQIIVAGGGDASKLMNLIQCNGLNDKIKYIGFRTDLANIMAEIDIYLTTYPIGGGLMNAFAMANKKPIISLVDQNLQHTHIENQYDIEFQVSFTKKSDFFVELDSLVSSNEYRKIQGDRLGRYATTKEQFAFVFRQFLDQNLQTLCQKNSYNIDLKKSREIAFDAEKSGNGKFYRFFIKELKWLSLLFPKHFLWSIFKLLK